MLMDMVWPMMADLGALDNGRKGFWVCRVCLGGVASKRVQLIEIPGGAMR